MIIVYKRMEPAELDTAAVDAKVQVAAWFKANPKRRVCNAQLWYGRGYKIKKGSIEKDIDVARKDADK